MTRLIQVLPEHVSAMEAAARPFSAEIAQIAAGPLSHMPSEYAAIQRLSLALQAVVRVAAASDEVFSVPEALGVFLGAIYGQMDPTMQSACVAVTLSAMHSALGAMGTIHDTKGTA